jgi:hypothetical protein
MTSLRSLLLVLLSVGVATPVAATLNDSERPGSVLVFPKFIRGTFVDITTGQAVHAVTEIEVSVVCPNGATCDANQEVRLRAEWVCPLCTESSFDLKTTVGGTLYFNPEGVTVLAGVVTAAAFPSNATTTIPVPPCPRGYLIAWAVDGAGNPIKFDGLIGDAVIREGNVVFNGASARGYNAIPIQAADFLNTGDMTDGNGNGALDFDGSEYMEVTGKIFGTVKYENLVAVADRTTTDLTLLTLDVSSNRSNPVTNVGLNFFTPDEQFVDTATSFTCWKEQRLTDINSGLTMQRMGRKGLVESTYAEQNGAPVTLLGLVETLEGTDGFVVRDYAYSLFNDGNPVPTTFLP